MSERGFYCASELELRWPELGDKLFAEGEWRYGAYVPSHARERLYHLIEGYKLAADLLVAQAEADPCLRNKLVYPIIFSYRHFIELTLKSMLEKYGSMGAIAPDWSHHALEYLWKQFRLLLHNLDIDCPEEHGTPAVEKFVAEFATIDPRSGTFRYPTKRNGQDLCLDLDIFDLSHIRNTMQAIYNYFDGADGVLDQLAEARADSISLNI